jgi:hypothetical protein
MLSKDYKLVINQSDINSVIYLSESQINTIKQVNGIDNDDFIIKIQDSAIKLPSYIKTKIKDTTLSPDQSKNIQISNSGSKQLKA